MAGPWTPNLSWITSDLAVGGAFPAGRAVALAAEHGVGAVIDVRSESCDSAEELAACGLRFLHLPTPDQQALVQPVLEAGVAFAAAARRDNLRLLIHCEHGIGRSATLALCVLVDRGLGPLEALSRAKDARGLVSPSPAQYEAWTAWLGRRSQETKIPTFDAFRAIAYRPLSARA
ncbi:protein phosphatase [Phenylobacterium hankyongense]|uniref:Protein phosphatase n=1 Tax=Phenylobacterium hankyongense TaxID=1813876 RepID=A0A328B3A7_9CAUL|nr:dual specificity protein phosphatase family protein [Phenylobacterium hankyongense]RAK60921.1 protein phosphatase [Phenylobacterium hankyongense]